MAAWKLPGRILVCFPGSQHSTEDPMPQLVRADNTHAAQVVSLIDRVYREYGDRICLEDADADLRDLEGNYWGKEGAFVVLMEAHRVIGTHAVVPLDPPRGLCTFRRLYLETEWRGGDWGRWLMGWAVHWARHQGWRAVEFWSDTRFQRAHAFFERHGFRRDGRVREMQDAWTTYREYYFSADLQQVHGLELPPPESRGDSLQLGPSVK